MLIHVALILTVPSIIGKRVTLAMQHTAIANVTRNEIRHHDVPHAALANRKSTFPESYFADRVSLYKRFNYDLQRRKSLGRRFYSIDHSGLRLSSAGLRSARRSTKQERRY
jgi:hypothetical protein